ncbi:hypothetical protein BV22DRAFT_84464 [Leucogyrophana mollusca]|uniref:Uncharacterized protein n=1 Tax=Leucogyrophana mollusca TaxID=85980 RepID=A0ACB8BVN5_9AGAM|nr:hypothetical protein BV22DRAFT_84464 [Leucogyrophana mollusca]
MGSLQAPPPSVTCYPVLVFTLDLCLPVSCALYGQHIVLVCCPCSSLWAGIRRHTWLYMSPLTAHPRSHTFASDDVL